MTLVTAVGCALRKDTERLLISTCGERRPHYCIDACTWVPAMESLPSIGSQCVHGVGPGPANVHRLTVCLTGAAWIFSCWPIGVLRFWLEDR